MMDVGNMDQVESPFLRLQRLQQMEERVLWLSAWMIHNANHLRENTDGLKVGGHQASTASLTTAMTALYFDALRPEDRVAVKPHASPALHSILYLMGRQSRDKLERFRAFGGAQSYPSRTKDTEDVDFSTGSVGLGVAQTLFAALAQDYVRSHGWDKDGPAGRMIALLGDAELDEGNIYEALLEGHKHGLRNCWWVVDYNRQSLDAVSEDGQHERLTPVFQALGWDVVTLKYGCLQEAAFAEPGGSALRDWINQCPNAQYAALCFQGGAAWRARLMADFTADPQVLALITRRDDATLAALMTNLGGHDLGMLSRAFKDARSHSRPVVFFAYTIKGYGLPLAGHKDNHAGLMTPDQMAQLQNRMGIAKGHEWDRTSPRLSEADLGNILASVPFLSSKAPRRRTAQPVPVPDRLTLTREGQAISTQMAFGLLMADLAKSDHPIADRIVTTSPDVTVSTNLGGWVNRRKVYANEVREDVFRRERLPSTFRWDQGPDGQHFELGIAEMNLFAALSAFGLAGDLFGQTLIPVGTLYDPFISRGLDGLNYACYQDARFILAATPSGVTLAPEGGAHQSIATPLIGMSQPGLTMFEPAFVHELAVILRFALDHVQQHGKGAADPQTGLADGKGGSVYLRLSTRPIEQPPALSASDEADLLAGAYWLRRPGPNAETIIAYAGAIAPEAIAATGLLAEDRRDIGLLAVTSADRLYRGWSEAGAFRAQGIDATCHAERLLSGLSRDCGIVTITDGHPAALGWLGSVVGHRTRALGVSDFGQSGNLPDLYRAHGLDTRAILEAANSLTRGRPVRHTG
jgi:pyruvate dehydrogenase E1 component